VLSRRLAAIVVALILSTPFSMVAGAAAETYPAKPIKLVVGFGPGGPADLMARLVAAGISPILGQTVFVDNRPGAGGMLGAEAVADAEPDGYTLLLGNTANLIISPLLYKEVHYDPSKAFAPIANLGITPNILIVSKAAGLNSVQALIDYARKNPGKLNYASAGIGTPLHLIGEMFKQRLGLDIVHVPYKSGGQATQAVMTGETQLCFGSAETALPAVENGSVLGLAVTSDKRIPQMPNLPTMIEAGVPDFVSISPASSRRRGRRPTSSISSTRRSGRRWPATRSARCSIALRCKASRNRPTSSPDSSINSARSGAR
jgi:tripartite-type tricarboxylate transporter receptor subunit TctC